MHRRTTASVVAASIIAAASVFASGRAVGATSDAPPQARSVAPPAAAQSPSQEQTRTPVFRVEDFDNPTKIDNPWLPLKPGTQFHFRGSALDNGVRVSHNAIFTVTDLTKMVAGVRTVVVWDQDFSDGELVEAELVVFAQDNDGNVWHLGQYAEVFDEGELVGGRAWFHRQLAGARAGIMMLANPRLGSPAYSEGFAPAPYFWDDFGKVAKVGLRTCVPAGCFENVRLIEEFEPTKPNAFQLKYVARGVGYVRVGWRGSADDSKETMVLTRIKHLGPHERAQVRVEARKLEERASVYTRTGPLR